MSDTPTTPEFDRATLDMLARILFEDNPDGIIVSDAAGTLVQNAASRRISGDIVDGAESQDWSEVYQLRHEDGVTLLAAEDVPLTRALAGETIAEQVLYKGAVGADDGIFLAISARPLSTGGAVAVLRDVTERKRLADEIAQRNAELAAREQENRELIARLRVAVDELSTPVLEVWNDVLALPVVGIVDTQRSAQMTERLLAEIVKSRARSVIVDLTGVELIDTSTADRFIKLARSVQLLGARCMVSGIQPAVAQTLVELGVEFATLETHRNLKSALEVCIRRDAADRSGPTSRR